MSTKTFHGKPCRKCSNTERYISGKKCKACQLERLRKWKEKNPLYSKEYNKNYYKKYYKKNRKEIIKKTTAYHFRNTEKKKEWAHNSYIKNKQKVLERSKKWRENNREKSRESYRKSAKNNPHLALDRNRRRRARKAQSPGQFTEAEFKALCHQYGNKCLCCGRGNIKLTPDHIIPLSKNGTNDIDNIQPLCSSCNSSKRDWHSTDYRTEKKYWTQLSLFELEE